MPKFFDRRVRGGPILGSAWWTPKWVRHYKIGQQGGPPGGPSFGSVFSFSGIQMPNCLIAASAAVPFWGPLGVVFGLIAFRRFLGLMALIALWGLMALLGHLGLMALLGRLALLALVGLMALPPSTHLAFSPFPILLLSLHRSAPQARGQFFFTVFWQGDKQNVSDPSRRGQLFLLSFSF